MTQCQTGPSHILAGQVSYFVIGAYLGGGTAGFGSTSNFLLIGDGFGSPLRYRLFAPPQQSVGRAKVSPVTSIQRRSSSWSRFLSDR